jgi:hypothetical protein
VQFLHIFGFISWGWVSINLKFVFSISSLVYLENMGLKNMRGKKSTLAWIILQKMGLKEALVRQVL